MHATSLLLLSAFVTATLAAHAVPPLFPDGCKKPPVPIKVIRFGPRTAGSRLFPPSVPCYAVGYTCSNDVDCKPPSLNECKTAYNNSKQALNPQLSSCVDGLCRRTDVYVDQGCDCLQGCYFKTARLSTRDQSCIAGICTAAECAACGEVAGNRACCGSGVRDSDGTCFCSTGAGEGCATDVDKCGGNTVCCSSGTSNVGRCCTSGTCNGRCAVN